MILASGRLTCARRRLICLSLLISFAGGAHCAAETYAIDNQPVLLYKIIQWWYDEPGTGAAWFCGRTLACRSREPIRAVYEPGSRRLTLLVEEGFDDLVALGAWDGSGGLRAAWLNSAWFDIDLASAMIYTRRSDHRWRLVFQGVSVAAAEKAVAMAPEGLCLRLEGPIRGLQDGRIALHDAAHLIQRCPANSRAHRKSVTVTLSNARTREVLAVFSTQVAGDRPITPGPVPGWTQ